MKRTLGLLILLLAASSCFAGNQLRSLGMSIGPYDPGKTNSITDVSGVRVGHVTLISGEGPLVTGTGPVRTGVTVIVPATDDLWKSKVMAGSFVLNGNGEAMGLMWLQESGILEGPLALTNTLSVADVQKGLVKWTLKRHYEIDSLMPLVTECDDSSLNDIHGMHVKPEHVWKAIEAASSQFEEGSVGAGTGMISFDFKSGIGSSSRIVPVALGNRKKSYTVGVLVNSNIGTDTRGIFRWMGIPIAKEIPDLMPVEKRRGEKGKGSISVVVATDAPLDSRQLSRIAKRAMNGVARVGTVAYNGSGDVAVAFSTANRVPEAPALFSVKLLADKAHNEIFEAVVDATEEAVMNSLLAAKKMVGRDGNTAHALPADRLKKLIEKYRAGK